VAFWNQSISNTFILFLFQSGGGILNLKSTIFRVSDILQLVLSVLDFFYFIKQTNLEAD